MDAAASLDLSVQAGGSEGSDESYHRGAEQAGPRAVEPRRTFLSPRSAAAALAEGQPGVTGVLKVAKQEVVGSLQVTPLWAPCRRGIAAIIQMSASFQ